MGYDIDAYLPKDRSAPIDRFGADEHLPQSIAHLRRGSHSATAAELFKALHAEEWDAGVSGNAMMQWFTRDEIIDAAITIANKLPEMPSLGRELAFLATILDRMTQSLDEQYRFVLIWFC